MKNKFINSICSLTLAICIGSVSNVVADYTDFQEQLSKLQQRIDSLEKIDSKTEIGLLKGLYINGGITMILQNAQNANAGYLKNDKTPTVASYSIDLTITKEFTKNDTVFLHLETGQGDLNKQLAVISGVNRDADDSEAVVAITEAWFKHSFNDNGFDFTIGKIDATSGIDNNAYANDETTQFLGSAFRNSTAISLPEDNSLGIQLTYNIGVVDFTAQYLEAKYTNDMFAKESDDEFTRDTFISLQANFKPNFIENLDGNYRIFAWKNNSEFVKLENGDISDNYGFGISIDQQLTDKLGMFGRYAWQNPYAVRIEGLNAEDFSYLAQQSWSIGAELCVNLLSEEDKVALAIGQNIVSDKFGDKVGIDFKAENHLEFYYSWQVTDYLAITPDLQVIDNAVGGAFEDDTIYVSSIRAQISF